MWGGRCWERTLLGSIVQKGKFSAGMEHLVNTWRGPRTGDRQIAVKESKSLSVNNAR
jgi:hypothetical protein